jgi:hypothetical protein
LDLPLVTSSDIIGVRPSTTSSPARAIQIETGTIQLYIEAIPDEDVLVLQTRLVKSRNDGIDDNGMGREAERVHLDADPFAGVEEMSPGPGRVGKPGNGLDRSIEHLLKKLSVLLVGAVAGKRIITRDGDPRLGLRP